MKHLERQIFSFLLYFNILFDIKLILIYNKFRKGIPQGRQVFFLLIKDCLFLFLYNEFNNHIFYKNHYLIINIYYLK